MSHPDDAVLLELAAGKLNAARRAELAGHLAGCARCKSVLDSLLEQTSPSGARLDPTRASDPLIGAMLGEYRVLERLGQGGMGLLYRGEQPVIAKPVAIKVMLQAIADDPVLVQRMIEEARAANAIRHPNIVDIFSFGQLPDGRPYMVMELLDGRPLAQLMEEQGKLTPKLTLLLLAQAMAALEAAHQAGVIHRDLKPDNIFVDPKPDGWRVTLLDFGLAKRADPKQGKELTAAGMTVGTPHYMAPEQVKGSGAVSTKTDIYAMGIVAWTMLAGREPFDAPSIHEVMSMQLSKPAPPVSDAVDGVPAGLAQLVLRMMQKDPDDRPAAGEVRKQVAVLLEPPKPVAPERSGAWAAVAIAVAIAIFGFGVWRISAHDPEPPPPPVAEPRPLPRPAPVGVEAPVAPTAAAVPSTPTWRCAKVTDVGAVDEVLNLTQYVLVVTIDSEPRVLVFAPHDRRGLQQLRKLHDELVACRGTQGMITAKQAPSASTWTKKGAWNGVGVPISDLAIQRSP